MAVSGLRWAWENRWIGLAAAVYAEACGGLAYTFAVYSDHLKETLGYTQTQIDALGSSKDFGGNTGVISGLMYNLFPPWVSVLIGGTCNLLGYLALWGTSNRWIVPPYWLVCLCIMVGANGETWVGTAVMVTSMQTFPTERGVVIGLLKAYIGISGAMFARVYKSFFEPHASAYILMQAVAPFVVSASVMFFIKPYPVIKDADSSETARRFQWSYYIVVVLAMYLMLITIAESVVEVGQAWGSTLTGVMLALLLLPAAIPFVGGAEYRRLSDADEEQQVSGEEDLALGPEKFVKVAAPELTLSESLQTFDYWLLFFAVAAGTGTGLTIINNLAQIGKALDTRSISSFVSLVSIWNCVGRLLAGYTSEWCVKAGYPRTLMLVGVIAVMGITQLLLASGASFTLYIGSILVGLSYGAHWTLIPVITSEMFGLKHYGAIYNTVTISSPLAAYFLSTWVAGILYDREAEAQHAVRPSPDPKGAHTCHGPECFRTTLLILALVCAVGVGCGLVLVSRTRALYKAHTVKPDSEQGKQY